MSIRAEALAARIEEGARTLASFAERLTDSEWNTVVRPDGRTVGVIVHHVANVYPIEIQLVRQVASGSPIEDVTWPLVADMNAIHAHENRDCCKHETLHLLGAQDHYSTNDLATTCELPSCVMQYAPSARTVGERPLLCRRTRAILQKRTG